MDFDTNSIIDKQGIRSQQTLNFHSYLIDEARDYIELLENVKKENQALNAIIDEP